MSVDVNSNRDNKQPKTDLRDVGGVDPVDAQLDMVQVPTPVLLPLTVRRPPAGPHGLVLLPIEGVDGLVQPLHRDGRLEEEGAVLEGVPLPDTQVVRCRARRRVRAGAGPGGRLGGALSCGVSAGQSQSALD